MYVCDYCGEFVIANGNKQQPESNTKCKICGGTQFHYFVSDEHFHPPISPKIMQLRFGELIPQWEKHKKQGITPTSGETPLPRCPTCGSTNIRRISSTEKIGNIFAFGLYGNKRKYQFECLNPSCRYKW